MQWNFPKFAHKEFSEFYQVRKIAAEAQEVVEAFHGNEGQARVIEEVLDVLHSCETFLRNQPIDLVNDIRNEVVEKNQRRGYYNAKTK